MRETLIKYLDILGCPYFEDHDVLIIGQNGIGYAEDWTNFWKSNQPMIVLYDCSALANNDDNYVVDFRKGHEIRNMEILTKMRDSIHDRLQKEAMYV